jgi:hypothetical protein
MEKKYLYGASVQGIQQFIFKTNKLREISGASELIEDICNRLIHDLLGYTNDPMNNPHIIQNAAGNIKCTFSESERHKLEELVLNFPKKVQALAPGITISQAVVSFTNDEIPLTQLEDLLKVQRNKLTAPTQIGFMGIERCRRTGDPAVKKIDEDYIDQGTNKKIDYQKHKSLFNKIVDNGDDFKESKIPTDIKDITKSAKNSWIAVIHVDGNGLGQILRSKGSEISRKKKNKVFSKAIENATINAVYRSLQVIKEVAVDFNDLDKYPFRPIVLGGDDVTIIMRADLAFIFTKTLLEKFEQESKNEFSKLEIEGLDGLTACAGIAYIKNNYPLHYGIDLAEALCKDAKKFVKANLAADQIPPSALSLHKVQDSFITDLDDIKSRTLQSKTWNFYAGPYLLSNLTNENGLILKLRELDEEAKQNDGSKAVSKLRKIISESYNDTATTSFLLERMRTINQDFYNRLNLNEEYESISNHGKSTLLDLITLHSFNYGNKQN